MNNLEKITNFNCNNENFKYGLSLLHGWIKCLECMLDISYKQGILMSNKRVIIEQKKRLQIERNKFKMTYGKN